MPPRIKTLLLEANGTHWMAVGTDTVIRGILGIRAELPERLAARPWMRRALGRRYEMASYMDDWKDAFLASPALDVEVCNITNLVAFTRARTALAEYPLIVVLHSAAGDRMSWLLRAAGWFQRRRGVLAVFIGNEYDLMQEKIRFIRESGADYICTQLPLQAAAWLYEDCTGSTIVPMPHALNPSVYTPGTLAGRPVDVGFVGDLYERVIGDRERTDIVRFFAERGREYGLECDIRTARMRRGEWADFLRQCHGVVGAESGTYYLDRDGRTLRAAKAYLDQHPQATFDEVFEACFRHARGHVNGKAISSRHFEPIGTLTCQLLVEGHYNGILEAGRHYIAVKPDLSNVDEAVRQFKDEGARKALVREAYEHVRGSHTYDHRVAALVDIVEAGGVSNGGRDRVRLPA